MTNSDFKWFWIAMAVIGVAVAISAAISSEHKRDEQAQEMRACSMLCGGHVASFTFDWARKPICVCRGDE